MEPEMEAQIWSALPPELLLYQVLPRLPLLDRLRLRSVCRKWSAFLLSNPYIEHCRKTSASSFLALFELKGSKPPPSLLPSMIMHDIFSNCWVYLMKLALEVQVFLYDRFADCWHPLSRPLIPRKFPHRIRNHAYGPLTSAGGLICFQHLNVRKKLELIICNPVLNEWMDIPELCHSSFGEVPVVHLRLYPKPEGSGFFLVLASRVVPCVFDSATRSWIRLPINASQFHCFRAAVVIQGIAYILAFYDRAMRDPVLIWYDLIHVKAGQFHAMDKETCVEVRPHLFELYGKLVMIGFNARQQLCMWAYDIGVSSWMLLKSIPSPSWNEGKCIEVVNHRIFQDQNLFYFYNCNYDHDFTESGDYGELDCEELSVLEQCDMFDVENNQWKQLPKGPYKGFCRRIMTFMPTLHHIR